MRTRTHLAVALFTLLPAWAETIVLQNFTLIDGTGKAPVANAAMVITDGRIQYAGPKANAKIPQGATTQDLAGKYVMPGIINLHGHLGNVQGLVQDPRNYTPANLDANLKTYASYGVTTVVSMGTDQDIILSRRAEQRATGRPKTTRIFTAYRGFTGKDGYPTKAAGMKGVPFEVSTRAEVKKYVDLLADKKVDIVKVWVDDHFGVEKKIPLDLTAAIIEEAHKHGLKAGAHVFYYDDAKTLVERGLNALLHSVRDKDVDDAFIATMKKHNAWLAAATLTRELSSFAYAKPPAFLDDPFFARSVSADVVKTLKTPGQKAVGADPRFAAALETAKRNLKRLVDAGVKHGFGTDTGPPARFPGFFEHLEMQMMAEAGLTPAQIIQAATKNSAEFLGESKNLGTLEAGRWADLIVLGRNPLADIKNTRSIETVMIAGQKVN
jgi:imidazolonepropionase-like amidohydrolase